MEDVSVGEKKVEKKPRKRMKQIRKTILKQMEFYFSDSNLQKDRFIKKEMEKTKDGYVDLTIFLKFNRIKALTEDVKVLCKAVAKSTFLQVNEENNTVRRTTPLREPKDTDRRTVYIECLPRTVTHEWVEKTFSQCGDVAYVSLPRYHTTGDLKGFGFVEFVTEEGADKACKVLNNPPPDSTARAGKFPKTNKTLINLQKKTGASVDVEEPKEEATTEDAAPSKPCKKHRKRRRCASESSMDLVTEGVQIVKKKKLDSPEVKSVKPELGHEIPAGSDATVIKQGAGDNKLESKGDGANISYSEDVKQDGDEEDKKESKRKKRKRQRLSDTSKSQEEDLQTSDSSLSAAGKDGSSKIIDGAKCSGSDDAGETRVGKKRKAANSDPIVDTSCSKMENASSSQVTVQLGKKDKRDSSSSQSKTGCVDKGAKVKNNEQSSRKQASSQKQAPKKEKKRKRRKKQKEKDVTLPQLRVIPKNEWLSLRKEYLTMQKKSMADLKQKLKEIKTEGTQDVAGGVNKRKAGRDNSEVGTSKPIRKIEFQPNVIIQVSSKIEMNRKKIKEHLAPDIQVAYVDVLDGAISGYIRCEDKDSARKLANSASTEYSFTLVSGDKESEYWSKLASDQEAKLSKKNRSKKRGVQKLIDKAYKHNSETIERKHIMFED